MRRSRRRAYRLPLFTRHLPLTLLFFVASGCGTQAGPKPPGQPASGPGGTDYKHAAVEALRAGESSTEFWIFSPADPRPKEAPVVFFMHGWGAVDPRAYGAWLQHLVRKGNIVVYPRYQLAGSIRTPREVMYSGAAQALQNAWKHLMDQGPVRPRTDKVGWVGHSMGGTLAVKLAANAATLGLPPAAFVFSVQPGGDDLVPLGDLGALPAETIVEVMTGEDDSIAGDATARRIFDSLRGTGHRVELARMQSEGRSRPKLKADHFAPLGVADGFPPAHVVGGDMEQSGGPLRQWMRERRQDRYDLDALDWYGFWKIADALIDAAFRGGSLASGFGGSDQQRSMGTLSDGTPVVPLIVEGVQPAPQEPQTHQIEFSGFVERMAWTKSYESWDAGGSEYYVLVVDQPKDESRVILRPSEQVRFEDFEKFAGKHVVVVGQRAVPKPYVPEHPIEVYPTRGGPPVRGSGLIVHRIQVLGTKGQP